MSSFGSFLFSSFIGSNTEEMSNLRNAASRNQNRNSNGRESSAGPSTAPRMGSGAVELPAQSSSDSKDGPLPSGPDRGEAGLEAPPPYSVLPTSSHSTASPSIYSASVPEYEPPAAPSGSLVEPPPSHSIPKIPESDAISASKAVEIVGPLIILGSVSSSSRVTLSERTHVKGKVNSSSHITLTNGITVEGKVNASGSIKIFGGQLGVSSAEKVDASGSVEIYGGDGGVFVGEKVKASGSVLIVGGKGGVRVDGRVGASGSIELRGKVHVAGDVNASGKVKIICLDGVEGKKGMLKVDGMVKCSSGSGVTLEGDLDVEGNFNVGSGLTITGRLFVDGDLCVKGDVVLKTSESELIVSGKRTIHGSLKHS